jgi:hypothetical protein
MGMQKYRADVSRTQSDGAKVWSAKWMGGPSLAKIENCRMNLAGEPRATVYITGEADSFFSIPAVCSYKGVRMRGYVTGEEGKDGNGTQNLVFHHCYY